MAKILILGATSAIAQETARVWADRGDEFFLVARDADKLEAVSKDLSARGSKKVVTKVLDLSRMDLHRLLVREAEAALAGLDIVLIAYGILGDQQQCQDNFEETAKVLAVNFTSVVSLLTLIAGDLEKKRAGTIAVISSVAGDRGRQSNYVYGASKGGLNIFLQGLRNRLAPKNVQVLTVEPGFVDTPMTAGFKKGALFVKPDVIARGIVRSIDRRRNEVYLPWFWAIIMLIIKLIPECLFKRLKL